MDPRDYMEKEDAPERMHIYWNTDVKSQISADMEKEPEASSKSLKIAGIPLIDDHFNSDEWKDEVAMLEDEDSDGAADDESLDNWFAKRGQRALRRK